MNSAFYTIERKEDADELLDVLRTSAKRTHDWILSHSGNSFDLLRHMKFDEVGWHPIDGRPLNMIEQVNQTWTFATAILAARQLLELHPKARGFRLAPGAHASQDLDLMSIEPNHVGAEIFAAVHPNNNRKLAKDLAKLALRQEAFRYVFFMSPEFPGPKRWTAFESQGVQVWSVEL